MHAGWPVVCFGSVCFNLKIFDQKRSFLEIFEKVNYKCCILFQLFAARDVLLGRSLEVYEAYRKEQANVR